MWFYDSGTFDGFPLLFVFRFGLKLVCFLRRHKHAWNTYFMVPKAGKSTEQKMKTGRRKVGRKHTVRFGNVGQ